MMTAKNYLKQIKVLDLKIKHRKAQVSELKQRAYISSSFSDGDRVQTSASGDKLLNSVAAYVDLEAEIDNMILKYDRKKSEIITVIHSIDSELHINILYKRYVEYRSLERIACDLNKSYAYICNQHGVALQMIDKIINTDVE